MLAWSCSTEIMNLNLEGKPYLRLLVKQKQKAGCSSTGNSFSTMQLCYSLFGPFHVVIVCLLGNTMESPTPGRV